MIEKRNSEQGQLNFSLEVKRQIFGVSELTAAIQRSLESDFRQISVAGEISGCRVAASGHYYFCLKDERSQVKAVLFKASARFARCKPQDGLSVIVRGNLEVYEARGEYQLVVESVEPQGAGALQLAFEQLKKKLSEEGLFDVARKRKLPALPRRIGIITSPSGAVIRDILHVLERRFPGLHIRVYPALVQGQGAIEQVCEALEFFGVDPWAEVVIVARGGGSLEDLWTFNEERVARAVALSRAPVISAVGHETDFTICDFVADLRAPTPSAAAEVLICTRESLIGSFEERARHALQAVRYRLMRCARDLHQKGTGRAETLIHRALTRRAQRLDDLEFRLNGTAIRLLEERKRRADNAQRRLAASDLRLRFAHARNRLELAQQNLDQRVHNRLVQLCRKHDALALHLQQISPLTVLSRGYAIVQDAQGKALRSSNETVKGATLSVRLHQGNLGVEVR